MKLFSSHNSLRLSLLYLISILGAIGVLATILVSIGESWPQTALTFMEGSFLNAGSWGQTLLVVTPLALVALGAVVSFEAGYVNIGQEGQLLIGGAAAAYIGVHMSGPGPLVLLVLLLVGAVAGAVWAGIAALLKFWRGVPEVLTTLLLVTVAFQLTGYSLKTTSLIADPTPAAGNRSLSSPSLPKDTRLGEFEIFGNKISISIFMVLALAALVWVFTNKTRAGFRVKILGQNPLIASRIGISKEAYGASVIAFSGAMAGLGGAAILATGLTGYSFLPGFSLNFGWTGLLVALIARGKAWLVVLVAMLFSGFHTGSQLLAGTGVDRQIGNVTTALFVLALLIPPALIYFWERNPTSRFATLIAKGGSAA